MLEAARLVLGPASAETSATDTRKLARAIAFMQENFADAIGPERVAQEAGMSVRALQYGFRTEHGMTPGAFLKAIRLDRTRAMLLAAGPGVTVTDVALACGFNHLGEFGAAYLARFGERPSETLRSRG